MGGFVHERTAEIVKVGKSGHKKKTKKNTNPCQVYGQHWKKKTQ